MEVFQLGNFTVEIVDNPEDSLSSMKREQLINESIPVTRRAFRNEDVTESDVVIHALRVSTAVYMKDIEGKLIAFAGCVPETINEHTIIHLKGAALTPDYQGEGLYDILTSLRLLREAEKQDNDSLLIGTRTQSPVVYYTMSEKLGLYPRIGEAVPQNLISIAKAYAVLAQAKHSDFHPSGGIDFAEEQLIVRRAYGGISPKGEEYGFSMYGDYMPWLRDNERINSFVRESLDLNNGDAFVLIGPYSNEKCITMLRQGVHRVETSTASILERFQR